MGQLPKLSVNVYCTYTFDRFSWLVVVVERNAEQAVRTKVKNECGMQRMT